MSRRLGDAGPRARSKVAWSIAAAAVACSRDLPAPAGFDDGTTAVGGAAGSGGGSGGGSAGESTGAEPLPPWPDESLAPLVDPFIGTGGLGYRVGTTNPGASVPFGMIKPGPDTGLSGLQISFLNCTGYHYDQTHVWGFSHSRINGMGVPDYGALLVTPSVGLEPAMLTRGGARSAFDHAHEQASAGYYAVDLLDVGVHAELTATTRVALHRYTWSDPDAAATVLFDLGYGPAGAVSPASNLDIDASAGIVRGMTTVAGGYSDHFGGVPTYFVVQASAPVADFGVWDEADVATAEATAASGTDIGAWLQFELDAAAPTVELAVAISYVSIEQAEANLAAERVDFEQARQDAEAAWERELQRVRIADGDAAVRRRFYSALYHVLLAPTRFDDADGRYRGFDGEVHDGDGTPYHTDFSLWDTYRTLHPLLDLIQRDREGAMMRSLQRMYEQGGDLPKWPLAFGYTGGMLGTPADIVLAGALARGIAGFDPEVAYAGARLHATTPREHDGRADVEGYVARGWVAADVTSSSVSHTLEHAVADAALATMAAALGKADDAAMFAARAQSYRNLWSPTLGFLVPRNADGSFADAGFDPTAIGGAYAEGGAWHYLWMVPHDAAGLAALMGGEVAARQRLGEYFEQSAAFLDGPGYSATMPVPYYWHANEPSLHDVYLFHQLGDPDATARWLEWVRREHYGDGAAGLPGNDDAGTMSAWYVWSVIGLFPVLTTDRYLVTAPMFERVGLDLGDAATPERRLEIVAEGAGPGMIYVAGASFEGEPLSAPEIGWDQLERGGTLRLELADAPAGFGAR